MKLIKIIFITGFLLVTANTHADTSLDTLKKKYSYALGFSIANNLKRQNIKPDTKALALAIEDIMNNKPPRMSIGEMRKAMNEYHALLEKERAGQGEKNKQIGKKFLAEYKKKPGVKSLKGGILYRVLKSGKGSSPAATDTVTVHYTGKLINGEVFDSSYIRNQPATFPLNRVIKGWSIAVQNMKPGDKWEVVIPSELAYGERGAGSSIGPNETLIFIIELLKIKK